MLIDKIQNDLKESQLARDEIKVSSLRLLISEIHNAEIAKGGALSDDEAISVAQREIKKRREAAVGFRQGNREEQAQKEEKEAEILSAYLPPQMSDEELTKLVEETINATGAKSMAEMGKVMGAVMGKVGKSAEPSRVSAIVKEKLLK